MTPSPRIVNEIIKIVHQVGQAREDVPTDKDLYAELGVQSVNAIAMLLALEEKFDIELDDTRFVEARTVDQLVQLIHQAGAA